MVGRAEDCAGDAADVEAADLGQHVETVGRVRLIQSDRVLDHLNFVRQACVVEAGAPAGGVFHRVVADDGEDRGGRSRVADAEVAGAEELDAVLFDGVGGDVDARFERGDRLRLRHGRPLAHVL